MLAVKEGTRPEQAPKIVLLLARTVASEKVPNPIPIKWRMSRKEDEGEGLLVVIFEHGPTLMFTEAQVEAVEFPPTEKFPEPIIHTNAEAEEAVTRLPVKSKRKENKA
jgi:hypothetical protein